MKKIFGVLIVLLLILLTVGCIGDNKNGGASTPTQSSIITPTIDETLWVPVLDNTYVLYYTGIVETADHRWKNIPVTPNTAYRLNVNGEKELRLEFFTKETGVIGQRGYSTGAIITFAERVSSYNGIIKPPSEFENLRIEWVIPPELSNLKGTSQNVHVKLERYTGNASIFPKTTSDPSF